MSADIPKLRIVDELCVIEIPETDLPHDRGYLLETGRSFANDVFTATGEVHAAVIAFADTGTSIIGIDKPQPWSAFAHHAIDMCEARDDVWGLAVVKPAEGGRTARIFTALFEDDRGTIDHALHEPFAAVFTYVGLN